MKVPRWVAVEWEVFDPQLHADLIIGTGGRLPRVSSLVGALLPSEVSAGDDTDLYRHYDDDGRLLYVGITGSIKARYSAHERGSSWMDFASSSRVVRFDSRDEAVAEEHKAIKAEQPLFNFTYNDNPIARRRLVAYLVEKDRLDLLAPAVSRG